MELQKVRIAALLLQGQGEANPRKAATRALSVALAGRIADGSLAETTLDIAAKIAAGGLEALPVVEGIVVAAMQKLDFQHRQNTAEPCMRGRGQSLSEVQMERLQDAAFTLSTHSSNQLLKVFGLAKSHKSSQTRGGSGQSADDGDARPTLESFCASSCGTALSRNDGAAVGALAACYENLTPITLTFDETYLWQRLDAVKLGDRLVIVGGALPDHATVDAPTAAEAAENLAPMVMDFVVKRSDYHDGISVSSQPLGREGHSGQDAARHVGQVLQSVLAACHVGSICLAYDNATSFQALNSFLLGCPLPEALRDNPAWPQGVPVRAPGLYPFGAVAFRRERDGRFQVVFGETTLHTL